MPLRCSSICKRAESRSHLRPPGWQYHHLVNQNPANQANPDVKSQLHTTENVVSIPTWRHYLTFGAYNKKYDDFINIRQWQVMQSFRDQLKYGIELLLEINLMPTKLADPITQFIRHGRGKTEAWRNLEVSRFNKHADAIARIVVHMKAHHPSGLHDLISLMEHEDPYVRLSAARHCLDIDRPRALETLRELARTGNLARDDAFTVLRSIGEG